MINDGRVVILLEGFPPGIVFSFYKLIVVGLIIYRRTTVK